MLLAASNARALASQQRVCKQSGRAASPAPHLLRLHHHEPRPLRLLLRHLLALHRLRGQWRAAAPRRRGSGAGRGRAARGQRSQPHAPTAANNTACTCLPSRPKRTPPAQTLVNSVPKERWVMATSSTRMLNSWARFIRLSRTAADTWSRCRQAVERNRQQPRGHSQRGLQGACRPSSSCRGSSAMRHAVQQRHPAAAQRLCNKTLVSRAVPASAAAPPGTAPPPP